MLFYIGDGPDRALLSEDGRVRLLGELDDEEIAGVLNACDVFVNPSHNEGLPNTVLEAGAVGLPVIATDVGGTREIITSPDEGILVRHGDVPALGVALETLLSDGRERARLGAAIRRRVLERYAWDDEAVTTFLGPQ
jgi:glycosyltransferase involved in cell wall biosynthesis